MASYVSLSRYPLAQYRRATGGYFCCPSAWHATIATKKAVVQRMRAIETLGIINTIATDKTGTLTENRLSVQSTWQLQI